MSKLRDRIRETSHRRRGGLGFARSSSDATGTHFLVLAQVDDAAGASAAVEAGASAMLYAGEPAAVGAIVAAAGGIPVGCRLEAATSEQAAAVANAKADFFVFDDGRASADSLLERQLGHVLQLDGDAGEERLRMLAPLDLDAILLPAPLETLTVRDQLRLRRIVELTHAPLVVPAASAGPASMLEVWRDAGAAAVLVPAGARDLLTAIVAAAKDVPPPRERSDERPDPLVPAPPYPSTTKTTTSTEPSPRLVAPTFTCALG